MGPNRYNQQQHMNSTNGVTVARYDSDATALLSNAASLKSVDTASKKSLSSTCEVTRHWRSTRATHVVSRDRHSVCSDLAEPASKLQQPDRLILLWGPAGSPEPC